ncbi:MAG: sporulation protein YunB [Bacillota bacterium]
MYKRLLAAGPLKYIIVLGLVVLVLIMIFNHMFLAVFFELAEIKAVRLANRAINEAVRQEVEGIEYSDLIKYEVNQEGHIVLMQPDIQRINRLISGISLNIQTRLEQVTRKNVGIPLFQILGMDLLAGFGPDLTARIIPVGFVTPPKLNDQLESAGINQTRHKIYLDFDLKLKLIVPFSRKVTEVQSQVPVIEVTIIGQVPEVYVGINGR